MGHCGDDLSTSDPRLIRVFLSFLAALGVATERCVFRLAIDETADVEAATQWWAEQIGLPADRFRQATIKRHNPKTNRLNRFADYHGCLSIYVRRGSALYWRIEGLVNAVAARVWDSRDDYQVCDGPFVG
jgi:hypothetical protein